jgi:ACR3 family arsenite efflux pump ArsB
MSNLWKVLGKLQKKLIVSIPAAMVLGLLFGYFFETGFLKDLIVPFTFLMVYPMMVTLKVKELLKRSDTKLQLTAQMINFAIIPFLGLAVGLLFFKDNPMVVLGILIASLLPTSGMTISWTGFSKGNVPAAVKMTVIGLILGSVLTPVYIKFLMGTQVSVSLGEIFTQILFIVFLPLAAGALTQFILVRRAGQESFERDIKPKFPMVSTIGVLAIVFISMALKSRNIVGNPAILLYYLLPLIVLYGINFVMSTVVGKLFFAKKDAIALVYGTVMRNLSIALAIAMGVFKEQGTDIALIISIAYIIQVQAAAAYVKLTGKIFKDSNPVLARKKKEPGNIAERARN